MTTETSLPTVTLASLPSLGQPLEGGIFAGITTQPDGTHVAVVLLPARGTGLTWRKAMDWAIEQGGQLPSRTVAALIFANVKNRPQDRWHWTSEEFVDYASYAWYCSFDGGGQGSLRKSFEGCSVAVRCIPLSA